MLQLSSKLSLYLCFCISNMMAILLPILQNKQHLPNNSNSTFKHPLLQCLVMAIGEMLCLFIFLVSKSQHENKDKQKPPLYLIFALMLIDITGSAFLFISLNYLSGSTYSITSCSLIIFTAFFSKIILNTNLNKYQIFGCMLALIGAVITGLGQRMNSDNQQQNNQQLIGFVYALATLMVQGLEIVFIEKIYMKYQIDPLELVGLWGTMGAVFSSILLVIISIIKCPFDDSKCVQDQNGNYHMQYLPSVFEDLKENKFLLALIILSILAFTIFNYSLTKVIMQESAVTYAILLIFNNGFIWITGIVITLIGKEDDQFIIQSLKKEVILIKLAGFIVSMFGLLLYNRIIFSSKQNEGLI